MRTLKFTGINNATYVLEKTPLASGGEGDVYLVTNIMESVAKIYKPEVLSLELANKLRYMVDNPPSKTVMNQVAWPKDVVFNVAGEFSGFVMPKLQIDASLSDVYKYPPASGFPITMRNKITIAQNICVVINEIHVAGYIFGDFNPLNTGLNTTNGRVSFLDTDTYHVRNEDGVTFRCNVCAPGYCAPELLGKVSAFIANNPLASQSGYAQTPLPTFTKETDNFALAIHIFKLLMNGYTPFGGIIDTIAASQASPGVGDSAVRRDSYCFKPGFKHQSVAIPALASLPDEIANLFDMAFVRGRAFPEKRPSAATWYEALERYEQNLTDCGINPMHQYDKKNVDCPLCAADRAYLQAIGQTSAPAQQSSPSGPSQTSGKQPTSSQKKPQIATPISVSQSQKKPLQVPEPTYQTTAVSPPGRAWLASLLEPKPDDVDRLHKKIGRIHISLGLAAILLPIWMMGNYVYSATGLETMIGLGMIITLVTPVYLILLGRFWITKRHEPKFLKRLVLMEKTAVVLPLLLFLSVYMMRWYFLTDPTWTYYAGFYGLQGFIILLLSVCVLMASSAVMVLSLVYSTKRFLEYEELTSTTKICGICGTEIPAEADFCTKCGNKS